MPIFVETRGVFGQDTMSGISLPQLVVGRICANLVVFVPVLKEHLTATQTGQLESFQTQGLLAPAPGLAALLRVLDVVMRELALVVLPFVRPKDETVI